MGKIEIRNEILYKAPTKVGLLAEVTEALHDAGVNLLAIGAYDKGDMGEFLLLTSNNRTTGEVLAKLGGTIDMVPVVVAEVANEPGELARIARVLAEEGINVSQIHATTTDGDTATIVVRTDHEIATVGLLEKLQ